MKNILSKKVTVEQIHAEFDSAQERIQCEAEKILKELSIPTETALERKARLAEELGFVNSEVVEKAKVFKKRNEGIAKKLEVTKQQADTLQELRFHYPNEKFLTVDELNRICEKYGLIHAPIKNYIKDIPEKNLLEMKNAKSIQPIHWEEDIVFTHFKYDHSFCIGRTGNWPSLFKIWEYKRRYGTSIKGNYGRWDLDRLIRSKERERGSMNIPEYVVTDKVYVNTISKKGYFIAAPISHFNTKGLTQKGKFGFFNMKTEILEVKDPVVFEYCKNGFIRIVTKWGTDDDQSYLDPSLVNEKFN